MNARKILAGCAALLAAGIVFASQTTAQVKKGKTRPLTTKQMMVAVVKPNCASLAETLKNGGPSDEKGWETAVTQAALLNESGHMMMEDGRCPDGVWAAACKALQEGGQTLVARLEAKDVAGAQEAMKVVTGSCGTCHKAHKK
jgi:cytochrome c556